MIYSILNKVAFKFEKNKYITTEDTELISYGLFILFSNILYGTVCLLLGCIVGHFIESVTFYLSFLFVRKYAGGFHADTELRCVLLSLIAIISTTCIICLSFQNNTLEYFILIVAIASTIIISAFSPISSIEKPLSNFEIARYARKSRVRVILLFLIAFVFYCTDMANITISICIALILESLLLIIGKLKSIFSV